MRAHTKNERSQRLPNLHENGVRAGKYVVLCRSNTESRSQHVRVENISKPRASYLSIPLAQFSFRALYREM